MGYQRSLISIIKLLFMWKVRERSPMGLAGLQGCDSTHLLWHDRGLLQFREVVG